MSAQPHHFTTAGQLPEKDLRAIRAALVTPQDRQAFDSGLDVTLKEVRAGLDLAKLTEFVHAWWLIACDSVTDPPGRTDVHDRTAHIQDLAAHGRPLPRGDKTWRQLMAERDSES